MTNSRDRNLDYNADWPEGLLEALQPHAGSQGLSPQEWDEVPMPPNLVGRIIHVWTAPFG